MQRRGCEVERERERGPQRGRESDDGGDGGRELTADAAKRGKAGAAASEARGTHGQAGRQAGWERRRLQRCCVCSLDKIG